MNRLDGSREFFKTCMYGLVAMLEDLSSKKYGKIDLKAKYKLWSGEENSEDCRGTYICLKYKDLYMKFSVVGAELYPIDIDGFDYSDIKRITVVVSDCIGNLSSLGKPISSIEGVLNHYIKEIKISPSRKEKGAYDIVLS